MLNLKSLYGLKTFLDSTDRLMNLDLQFKVDNRSVNENSIFIAIVGEKYNPLENLKKIVESGCRFVVYEKNDAHEKLVEEYHKELVFIKVNNIVSFVEEAGTAVANNFRISGGKIIAISGSNGKTTTKEMLNFILGDLKSPDTVICTQKNNNNHLGVPFTLFQITPKTKYAIVELGSNHPGEIELLCKICKPQYGVTTNIGDTHLEFFKNRANVFTEEAILRNYTSTCFLVNSDDELLKTITSTEGRKTYGFNGNDYKLDKKENGFYLNESKIINKHITGNHNFINLSVAALITKEITEENMEAILKASQKFEPTKNRSQWIDFSGKKVFLDAYNANPSSMIAAISGFSSYLIEIGEDPKNSLLVLGDMNELGENSPLYHEELGEMLNQFNFGEVVFVGKFSKDYSSKYCRDATSYYSTDDLKPVFKRHTAEKKYIMIKGSRSLQLETILDIK